MVRLQVEPEVVLRHGALEARLAPGAGGRITALCSIDPASGARIDWLVPLADEVREAGFDADAWPKAGCYPLVPFSNRIRAARFAWNGRELRLPTHPGESHALHGGSQRRPWHLLEQHAADSATMEYVHVAGDDGWPWAYRARQRIELDAQGARLQLELINDSGEYMPCGLGFHPFIPDRFAHRLRLDAACVWPPDNDYLPTGPVPPAPEDDYSTPRAMARRSFTQYYAGCTGGIGLACPEGHTIEIEADALLDHLVLYRPAAGGYICVEPVSHVTDAANLASTGREGTGWSSLPPKASLQAAIRLRLSPAF